MCASVRANIIHNYEKNTDVTLVPAHVIKALDEGFCDKLHTLAAIFHGTAAWYQSKTIQGEPQSRCWTTERCLAPQA